MEVKRILFPTDYSECAEQAFRYAVELTVQFEAAALHVMHVEQIHDLEPEDVVFEPAEMAEQLHLDSEMRRSMGEEEQEQPEYVTSRVRAPSIGDAIVKYAEERHIDLIVMGTHGRSGLKRILVGSVAEFVARNAPCSVLTVHGEEEVHGRVAIKRMLVPIDFSAHSGSILQMANVLSERFDAHIDLLHVVEDVVVPRIYGVEPILFSSESFRKRLKVKLAKAASEAGIDNYRGHIMAGSAWREVIDFAEKTKPDLLVIGSRGLTGIEKILLGSVAENVIRRAPCPVLIVRGEFEVSETMPGSYSAVNLFR